MMIEINLLPHREAKRAADLRESVALLLLGLVLIGGIVYFSNKTVTEDLRIARLAVNQLEGDIERYKPQEKKVKKFKKKKKELVDKLDVIASLENARSGPIRLLDELSSKTPDRLWLRMIQTKKGKIELEGSSLDTGVVADFLRALNESPYFEDVDLDKTTGGKVVKGVRIVHFVVRAKMTKPKNLPKSEQS